jgi:hypothetical protein
MHRLFTCNIILKQAKTDNALLKNDKTLLSWGSDITVWAFSLSLWFRRLTTIEMADAETKANAKIEKAMEDTNNKFCITTALALVFPILRSAFSYLMKLRHVTPLCWLRHHNCGGGLLT